MANSPLVEYTQLSPNNSGQRVYDVTRFTPHCVVGQCSIEALGNLFSRSSTEASSNYGIGYDGKVGMFVPENMRSWCTSSWDNDQRGITVECASDSYYPYAFNNTVYNKLIELNVDIMKRYGKKKLIWIPSKQDALNYALKSDEMLLTVHNWFANKSCPGEWFMARISDYANQVNARFTDDKLKYRAHVQTYGWQNYVSAGEIAGTVGESKRLEAIQFTPESQITAQGHVQKKGDMKPVAPGGICGTTGKGLRLEAIKLTAPYPIRYRVHVENIGWMDWVTNGTWAGTKGKKLRIEAVEVDRAASSSSGSNTKSVTDIAREVIAGKWGNGSDREAKLTAAGYDYNAVQKEVNRLMNG